MTGTEQGGGRVVVGVDGSPPSRAALVWALADAARRGARLEVVSVFPIQVYLGDPFLLDDRQMEEVRVDTLARARALVDEVRSQTGHTEVPVDVLAVAGSSAPMLLTASEDADLLVVGSRGRGAVRSLLLGSVALSCVTHSRVPVVVVRPDAVTASGPARVVVGLDRSPASGVALEQAARQARGLGAEVVAVAAYSPGSYWSDVYDVVIPPAERLAADARMGAEQMVEDASPPAGVTVRVETGEGPAGEVLVRAAEGAQLLVVGGHGRGAIRGMLLGSVALHCVTNGPCPVMVVPGHRDAAGAAVG